MELKEYKLGDIAEIIVSSINKKSKEEEELVKLCNFVDVYHNWAISTDMVQGFMNATASEKNIERFSLRKGYVAFTKDSETRNDIGMSTYIADSLGNTVLGYHCALVKPNEKILSGKYLNAFLHSSYIKKYFELNATGSGMRYTLSMDTLNNIPVLIPSLEIQEHIGGIFSDIDCKICLNRAINHNLEAMAKQLYDYWFVQFNFPSEEGKPYKSSGGKMVWNEKLKCEIPEGWNEISLSSFIANTKGGDWGYDTFQDNTIKVGCVRGADIVKLNNVPIRYITEKHSDRLLGDGDIVIEVSGGSPIQATGRVALITNGVIERNGGSVICSNFCQSFSLKNRIYSEYFYYLWKCLYENDNMFNFEGKTSGIKNFQTDVFLATRWMEVPEDLIMKFHLTICEYHKLIDQNIAEQNNLTKQRDELLPLLMNGQVTVNYDLSHIEKEIESLFTSYFLSLLYIL